MPPKPPRSRSVLSVGTVFYHRQFQGRFETKDRFFIVVGADEQNFLCFTTSTSQNLLSNRRFSSEITPIIQKGSECFPKDCVVDCTELHSFDDIAISSYISSGRVTVEGTLSGKTVEWIVSTVSNSQLLSERDINKVLGALDPEPEE